MAKTSRDKKREAGAEQEAGLRQQRDLLNDKLFYYGLDDLRGDAEAKAKATAKKMRLRYKIAREVGLSAVEARLLSVKNDRTFRNVIAERVEEEWERSGEKLSHSPYPY